MRTIPVRSFLQGRLAFSIGTLCASLLALPALAQAPGQTSAVIPNDCNRACLIDHARAYMKALAAHDPSRLPLARGVQFTENDVAMRLGQGVWGTISDVSADALEVADPETGNAAWFGYVKEHGEPAIYAMRIRVVAGRITEVETVVHRKTGLPAPFGDVTKIVHDPQWQTVLPPEQRRSRPRLQAVAQSYFNTVEANDGQVFAPFSEDCGRLENGISTTSGGGTGGNAGAIVQGCEAQFKLGIYRINKRVRERRYPIIDTERGIVVSTGFFDHANEFDHYLLTNGREMKTAMKWPNTISLLEAFRVTDGKISRIEAVFTYVPYFRHNPWDTSEAIMGPPEKASVSGNPNAACDRACLTGAAEKLVAAMVAHAPYQADWAPTVHYAENSVPLTVGEGVWGAIDGAGKNPLIVADPEHNSVAWVGSITEHGQPSWFALRATMDGKRIATVESFIRRKEGRQPYADPTGWARDRSVDAKLEKDARMDPAAMTGLVDGYFNSVARNDGTVLTKTDAGCTRSENGVATPGECGRQLALAQFRPVDAVRDRDYVVDAERGLVVSFAYRDLPQREQAFVTTDGKPFAAETKYPLTYGVASVFKLGGGTIRRIDEISTELSYLSPAPWGN